MCHIDIHLIISNTCKHDTAMYCGNYEMFISHVIFIFLLYYFMHVKLQLRECLQVKSYRKSKRIPAYGLLEFY